MNAHANSLAATGRHAVVIGGSLAGMLASRILVDHFDRVTLVERDRFPEGPVARTGVPQARHVHALLARGRGILEQLFPGLGAELTAAGAHLMDVAEDIAWLTPGGWGVRFRSGIIMLSCSRDLLDWMIRGRVAAQPGLRLHDRVQVTSLVANADRTRVLGVALRRHAGPDGGPADPAPPARELAADLVVDASGRGSRLPQWLAALGYPPPQESVIDASLGYASRLYRRPAARSGWTGAYLQAAPPARTRGGIILPIEGDRWLVTLIGGGGDHPPTDEDGFLEFLHRLPSPILYDAVRAAAPLSPITGYQATENRWRHYERLARRPEGLLVLGDAACAFNPVYGQGMTTAGLGALALDQALREQRRSNGDLSGLAARFQQALAKVNEAPWLLAIGEDVRYPTTEKAGVRSGWGTRLMHWYLDRLVARAARDAGLRRLLLEVLQMIKPPAVLSRPAVATRVLLWPARRTCEVGWAAPAPGLSVPHEQSAELELPSGRSRSSSGGHMSKRAVWSWAGFVLMELASAASSAVA
jgi:flavin-dependent dehydrogenase